MNSIEAQLGESLGVLVEHSASLPVPKLLPFLEETFGRVSYSSTYILTNDHMATIVFFSESSNTTNCYLVLEQLTRDVAKPPGLEAVAWLSEAAADEFEKKSYVKCRWKSAEAAPAGHANVTGNGYITVFWKRADDQVRDSIRQAAAGSGELVDSFVDEKEGGRLFLRFQTEHGADAYRRFITSKYEALRRDISYGSAEEYQLATASAHNA